VAHRPADYHDEGARHLGQRPRASGGPQGGRGRLGYRGCAVGAPRRARRRADGDGLPHAAAARPTRCRGLGGAAAAHGRGTGAQAIEPKDAKTRVGAPLASPSEPTGKDAPAPN
jgi:hypothetical protein